MTTKLKLLRWFGHQSCLPEGLRFRVLRQLTWEKTHEAFEVDFFGFRYAGTLDQYIDWWVYFFGAYEPHDLKAMSMLAVCRPDAGRGPVVYDVGANVGHHTLFAAGFAETIIAFEPYAPVRTKLLERMRLNNIDYVRCFEYGLGAEAGNFSYMEPENSNSGNGYFSTTATTAEALHLQIRVGDAVVREEQLPPPDFIKIDVEGFEPFALLGLRETLETYRPVVMVELSEACAENMRQSGYESFWEFLPEGYSAFLPSRFSVKPARELVFHGENYFFIPDEMRDQFFRQ